MGKIDIWEFNLNQSGNLVEAGAMYVGARMGRGSGSPKVTTSNQAGLGSRISSLKTSAVESTKNTLGSIKQAFRKFNSNERGSFRWANEKPKTRFIVGEKGRTVDLKSSANPNNINFSQRSVSSNVDDYAKDMKVGNWDWTRITNGKESGPIRVMEVNGKLISYDNRRLMAARQAGLKEIPIIKVNPNAIMPGSKSTWASKFKDRRFDDRNVIIGGVVPKEGLSSLPKVISRKN